MTQLEKVKNDLINEIKERQNDKIIEESNAKLLIELIKNTDTIEKAIAIAELGTTYKRTGFHFDKRLEKIGTDIHYFKKNNELSFEQDKNMPKNKLIIGDNYDALQNLLITHRNKVDVIYIDPPYSKDSMGQFAQTNYDNSLTRDNLLSMLYPRLILAKQLLTDEGIIFCSIDDKNQAYVKCLFDEIFGEKNFIQCYNWECNFKPDNSSSLIRPNAEYVLCFAKNKTKNLYFKKYNSKTTGMPSLSKNKETIKKLEFPQNTVFTTLPDGHYESGKYENNGWELLEPIDIHNGKIITQLKIKGPSYWATKEKIQTELENGTQIWIKSKKFIPYYKKTESGMTVPTTILPREFINDYSTANKELKSIMNNYVFDNPKPISLIKFLISCIDKQNATVLDFFAGSGTTGQAVLELNKEDGGNRRFILCTNNEDKDGYIATNVTSKRLKRVMTGKCYDGTDNFDWIKKNKSYGGNLDVFEIKTVNASEQSKGKTPFDVIDETYYDLQKFLTFEEKLQWICENFDKTQKYIEGE